MVNELRTIIDRLDDVITELSNYNVSLNIKNAIANIEIAKDFITDETEE